MRLAAAILVIISALGAPVLARQQIPEETMLKMRQVFTDVRDDLWLINDDFWHRGQLNRCIGTMRVLTSIDPHSTEAYENTAWLMYSDLREHDAEAFLREGLANNIDVYDLYLELGTFCYFRMRYPEAIDLYTGCVTFEDAPKYARRQLAHALEKNGDIGEALEMWLQIEASDQDYAVPEIQIDRILQGGEPSMVPEMTSHSIETRHRERHQQK